MIYNKKDEHLIPPIIFDKAKELYNNNNRSEIKENFAKQLEVVRDYCTMVLETYGRKKSNPINTLKR